MSDTEHVIGHAAPCETDTQSCSTEWQPRVIVHHVCLDSLRARAKELTPKREELMRFAESHRPPEEWLASGTDDPFTGD